MVELRQLRPVQPQREMCEDATVARPAAAPQTDFLIGLPLAYHCSHKLPRSNCLCCSRERFRIGSAHFSIDTAVGDLVNLVLLQGQVAETLHAYSGARLESREGKNYPTVLPNVGANRPAAAGQLGPG